MLAGPGAPPPPEPPWPQAAMIATNGSAISIFFIAKLPNGVGSRPTREAPLAPSSSRPCDRYITVSWQAAAKSGRVQGNRYLGALTWIGPDFQRAPVPLDDMFDDCQAKAGAARFPAACRIDAVKPFGKPRQMFRSDSFALVTDRKDNLLAVRAHRYRCRAGLVAAAVPDRIADEVVGQLKQLTEVAHDHGHISINRRFD